MSLKTKDMKSFKFTFHFYTLIVLAFFSLSLTCSKAQSGISILDLDAKNVNQLKAELKPNGVWELETSGKDAWIYTMPLKQAISSEATIMSFEYFCPIGLDYLQVYFSPLIGEKNSKLVRRIGLSEGWVGYTIDLSKEIAAWGKTGDWLRLDYGSRANVSLQIRNLMLRPMTEREKELAVNREEKVKREAEMIPVTVAQHPLSNIGRSFHNFNQPHADKYDLTPYTDQGLCFEEQWNKVEAVYYDHIGDVEHRNSPGQGQAGPYVNTTGRNDIVTLKVAYDASAVYFYAETREALSPSSDPNWMLLFVDTDQNKETGWEGYELLINSRVTDNKTTTMVWLNKDGSLGKSLPVPYQISQNKLMIKVKRSDLSIQ